MLVIAMLLLACLLAHELAHAVVARRLGVRVESITLWALGGMTAFADEPPTPRASALVSAAGPAVSIALGGAFVVAASLTDPVWLGGFPQTGFGWLAVTNVLLGVFNLLPATPLDGGRLRHAWLWRRNGDEEQATVRPRRSARRSATRSPDSVSSWCSPVTPSAACDSPSSAGSSPAPR